MGPFSLASAFNIQEKDASAGHKEIIDKASPKKGHAGENILVDATNLDVNDLNKLTKNLDAVSKTEGMGKIIIIKP